MATRHLWRLAALLIVASCVSAALSGEPRDDAPREPAHKDWGTIESFPTFGLVAKKPDGWIRVPEESVLTAVRWIRLDENRRPTGVITVDRRPVDRPSLKDLVDGFRKKLPTEEPATSLGGDTATFLSGAPHEEGLHLAAAIITQHAESVYVVSCFALGQEPWREAMEQARGGVQFVELVEPVAHLDALRSPGLVVQDQLRANLPEVMRPVTISDPPPARAMAVYNCVKSREEFSVQVNPMRISGDLSPAQVRARFTDEVRERMQIRDKLKWTDIDAPFRVSFSPVVTARVAVPGQAKRQVLRVAYGMAFPTDRRAVLFTFAIRAPEEELQRLYEELIPRIMASVRAP